mmetsp:Transcript_29692/g.59345  ORF Transcript_29692/g.59345 Transcript_29692/m.59345 type:complete len:142 (-) Transcript_29692:126-551(-)
MFVFMLVILIRILPKLFQIHFHQTLGNHPPTTSRNYNRQYCHTDQKYEKPTMIPLPYTISHPGTMMVEFTNADIAGIAMFGAGRAVNVAGGAVSVAEGSSYEYRAGWFCGIGCRWRLHWYGWTDRGWIGRNDARVYDGTFP